MTFRYVGWRFMLAVFTAVAIVLLGFVIIHLAPGEPVLALAGEHGDASYYQFMRERFGLDRPLTEQLAVFASRFVRGDFGVSYVHGRPPLEVIGERVPATLLLTGTALVVSSVLGLLLGGAAALRSHRLPDITITTASLGLYAAPVFWIGQIAVLVLAVRLGVFPVQGMSTAGSNAMGVARVLDVAHHLLLPALVLASQEIAAIARLTRRSLLDELATAHIRSAKARGIAAFSILGRHALRRTLLPVITVIGDRIGHVIAGAVVVEIVFGWPGVGRLLLSAVQTRDAPILLGLFWIVSLSVLAANFLTDVIYSYLDPRIRYRDV